MCSTLKGIQYQLSSVYGLLSTGSALHQTLVVVALEKDVRLSGISSILASASFLLVSGSGLPTGMPLVVWRVPLEGLRWLPPPVFTPLCNPLPMNMDWI